MDGPPGIWRRSRTRPFVFEMRAMDGVAVDGRPRPLADSAQDDPAAVDLELPGAQAAMRAESRAERRSSASSKPSPNRATLR
jgi:hypothetical protein